MGDNNIKIMGDNNIKIESKKEFVFKAFDDATNTLRFIDTKVAAVFIAIGLVTTFLTAFNDEVYNVYKSYAGIPVHCTIIGGAVLIYFITIIVSIFYGFKTLEADNNPMKYTTVNGFNRKNLWYLINGDDNKININLDEYVEEINNINEDEFLKMISLELMKVSAIRNIKIKNVNKSFLFFKISLGSIGVLLFYVLYFYSIFKI